MLTASLTGLPVRFKGFEAGRPHLSSCELPQRLSCIQVLICVAKSSSDNRFMSMIFIFSLTETGPSSGATIMAVPTGLDYRLYAGRYLKQKTPHKHQDEFWCREAVMDKTAVSCSVFMIILQCWKLE